MPPLARQLAATQSHCLGRSVPPTAGYTVLLLVIVQPTHRNMATLKSPQPLSATLTGFCIFYWSFWPSAPQPAPTQQGLASALVPDGISKDKLTSQVLTLRHCVSSPRSQGWGLWEGLVQKPWHQDRGGPIREHEQALLIITPGTSWHSHRKPGVAVAGTNTSGGCTLTCGTSSPCVQGCVLKYMLMFWCVLERGTQRAASLHTGHVQRMYVLVCTRSTHAGRPKTAPSPVQLETPEGGGGVCWPHLWSPERWQGQGGRQRPGLALGGTLTLASCPALASSGGYGRSIFQEGKAWRSGSCG